MYILLLQLLELFYKGKDFKFMIMKNILHQIKF